MEGVPASGGFGSSEQTAPRSTRITRVATCPKPKKQTNKLILFKKQESYIKSK